MRNYSSSIVYPQYPDSTTYKPRPADLANHKKADKQPLARGVRDYPGGLVAFGAVFSAAEAVAEDVNAESELKPIALDICSVTYRGRSGEYKTATVD